MNAAQIKQVAEQLGFEVVWSDLRRGVMHIRRPNSEAIKLVYVYTGTDEKYVPRAIREGFEFGRDLSLIPTSRYYRLA